MGVKRYPGKPDTDVRIASVGQPSALTSRQLTSIAYSSGFLETLPTITDNGDGTVGIAAANVLLRSVDSDIAQTTVYSVPPNATLTLTNDAQNYIYVECSFGAPQYVVTTSARTDTNTNIQVAQIYRIGTTLHSNPYVGKRFNDNLARISRRFTETQPFQRVSGGVISATGSRNFAISAGSWWTCTNPFSTNAFDSSGAGTFTYAYPNGVGGWTYQTAQTQINNTQYYGGSGALATLTANRYGVHWVYLEIDNHVFVVFGSGDYKINEANAAVAPSATPPSVTAQGRLIGKIIVQKSAATFTSVLSAFEQAFEVSPVTDHENLTNLLGGAANDHYHLTGTQHTSVTSLVPNAFDVLKEPTGFPNRTDSTVSFVDGTRTFTIQPVAASFDYYIHGVKYTITTPKTVVLPNTTGTYFIYFDNTATLTQTTTFSAALLQDYAYVFSVYWNATVGKSTIQGEERHGAIMDSNTHVHFHFALGTTYRSGLAVGNITTDQTGNLASDAQFSIGDGAIEDEDILHTITNGAPETLSPILNAAILYRAGAAEWTFDTPTAFPVKTGGTGRLAYNSVAAGVWGQTEAGNNAFVLCHILATNDIRYPIVALQGQAEYGTIPDARSGAASEISNIAGLPYQEFKAVATIIYQTSNAYANIVKARTRSIDVGTDYVDWRTTSITPGVTATDHNSLGGLQGGAAGEYYHMTALEYSGIPNYTYGVVPEVIAAGVTVTVPADYQMVRVARLANDGTLINNGRIVVLE